MKNRRFYRDVQTVGITPGKWQILLDGKPAKSPAGNPLILPARSLADAIADEWRRQAGDMRPERMKLTRLANTAIDHVSVNRQGAVAKMLNFAANDLLCFRAPGPRELAERQSAAWDPLLNWARERHGVHLDAHCHIRPIALHNDDLTTLEFFLRRCDNYSLTALVSAANILGSAILALALHDGRINPAQALETAELDTAYQAEVWGGDPEGVSKNLTKIDEVSVIAQFLAFNRAV